MKQKTDNPRPVRFGEQEEFVLMVANKYDWGFAKAVRNIIKLYKATLTPAELKALEKSFKK